MGALLDEIDPFPGTYTLEVSSPGPNRPLRKLEHFKAVTNKRAKIQTSKPIEGRAAFTGTIKDVNKDKKIIFALEEGKRGSEPIFEIPFESISNANLA